MDLGLAQHVPTNPNWCHGTLSQLLPLTGLSCSLDRCHADLDQDQAAPAVSQWNTVGLPLDPDADSNHPISSNGFWDIAEASNCLPRKNASKLGNTCRRQERQPGGCQSFPPAQEPKSPRTNTGGSSKCQPPLRPSQDPELGPPGALGWDKKFVDFKYALTPNQVDISGFWVNK